MARVEGELREWMMVSHSVIGTRNAGGEDAANPLPSGAYLTSGSAGPYDGVTTTGRKRSAAAEAAVGGRTRRRCVRWASALV